MVFRTRSPHATCDAHNRPNTRERLRHATNSPMPTPNRGAAALCATRRPERRTPHADGTVEIRTKQ